MNHDGGSKFQTNIYKDENQGLMCRLYLPPNNVDSPNACDVIEG